MNDKQVAHLWANRSRTSARGSHFYFDGDTIYSYGPHFPVARLITSPDGETCVLFTTRSYSNSTARHKSIAAMASSQFRRFMVEDVTRPVVGKRGFAKLDRDEQARQDAAAFAAADREARIAKRNAKLLAKYPGMTVWEARRAQRAETWCKSWDEQLPLWRDGGPLPLNSYAMPVALRVRGDRVETTKGASVPVDAARVTFAFATSRRESGWHRNGEKHAIGDFQLDAVNAQGIVAGCHHINWDEIDSFAKSQGWIN